MKSFRVLHFFGAIVVHEILIFDPVKENWNAVP